MGTRVDKVSLPCGCFDSTELQRKENVPRRGVGPRVFGLKREYVSHTHHLSLCGSQAHCVVHKGAFQEACCLQEL